MIGCGEIDEAKESIAVKLQDQHLGPSGQVAMKSLLATISAAPGTVLDWMLRLEAQGDLQGAWSTIQDSGAMRRLFLCQEALELCQADDLQLLLQVNLEADEG